MTIDLLEYGFPRVARYEPKHYVSVYRAATKFAERVGRPGRAFITWGPNPELAAILAEDASAETE